MTIEEMARSLELETIQGEYQEADITGGYTSDLLSDVMANAREGNVLVTIQAHKNAVAVAGLVGIRALVFCNSRPVPTDVVRMAATEGIALFRTPANQFTVSGRLYGLLS